MGEEQLKVLQLIDDGIISADDGILLLNTLAPIPVAESEQAFEAPPSRILQADDEVSPSGGSLSHLPFWRRFWLYPLLLGGSFVTLGFTYTILTANGAINWAWLFLTLPTLALGLVVFLLGWLMRSSYWLSIKVKNEDINLMFGLPLPLKWIIWTLKIARLFMPDLRDLNPNDLFEALAKTSTQGVFSVDVQEGDSEHVRVFYG